MSDDQAVITEIGGGPWLTLDPPMVLGEAPIFRPSDHTLHWNDCLDTPPELHILPLDPATGDAAGPVRTLPLADSVTVQLFRRGRPGSYICAYYQGVALLDEATGALEVLREIIPAGDRAIRRFNDGGVDAAGRFWLAEIDVRAMAFGAGSIPADYAPIGRLWRYDPDGTLTQMESGLVCGNGIGWSPDNKTMYLNDSMAQIVWAYDFDLPSGALSNKRIFIDRREAGGEPDGMVIDVEGNLWIAMWGAHSVMRFDPAGRHTKTITFTAKNMACTTFGGPGYDELYIASARDRSPTAAADDDGGQMFRYKAGVRGLPKYEFGG
ncbi:hypothetical protein HDZ31DRAFT_48652 [Schizophyllum fasciatum]